MSQLAKMVKTASPKPQQTDNEKYTTEAPSVRREGAAWLMRAFFCLDAEAIENSFQFFHVSGENFGFVFVAVD